MSVNHALPQSSPEAQGISSSAVLAFVDAAERHVDAVHSFMLLRHGCVVAKGWWSPYGPEHRHMLFSLSKSFASSAIGMAVEEELLTVNDPVLPFFPDYVPSVPDANLSAMRVRDLLTMTTGHDKDTLPAFFERDDDDWIAAFMAQPVVHKPGTHFVYNTGATYMLSAIVQRVTGMTLLSYLQPHLFEPLEIQNPVWAISPQGINLGGWGLSIKTEDIARFGQLYLQKGGWRDRYLLPESWVAEATARQVSNGSTPDSDWEQGYGYQFWRCRNGVYRGDGAFGQFCIVMPDQDAVMVMTGGLPNMQDALNLVWDYVLPGMGDGALPEDASAQAALNDKLANLSLRTQRGAASSPLADRVSGTVYRFAKNGQDIETIACDFTGSEAVVVLRDHRGEHRITCGNGMWVTGLTAFGRDDASPVAASGAWVSEDTFAAKLCLYETPFCPTLTFRFDGNRLRFDYKPNVSFGSQEHPQLVGQAM